METQLLSKNLSSSPIIPKHYKVQTIFALGGTVPQEEAASKQGGMVFGLPSWEDGSSPADPFSLEQLLAYCKRQEIFYVICPSLNEEAISVFVQNPLANSQRVVGKTLEGTFAAALVLLKNPE